MKKIPLEETIVESYKFLFGNIISIIGTLWLPVLLYIAVLGATLVSVIPHEWLAGNVGKLADPDAWARSMLPVFMLWVPVLMLSGLLIGAMIRVGILRHALDQKTTTTWVWFSLGARVWRMVAATLLNLVVYAGLVLAVVIAVGAAGFVMHLINAPQALSVLVTIVLVIAGIVWVIYTLLRMFFFLPAIIVDQNRVGVARSWELGKGNVWRMIVVFLAVVVPVVMVGEIGIYATTFSTLANFGIAHQGTLTPAEFAELLRALLPLVPVLVVIYLLMVVAMVGLMLGAIGKAYQAVTAGEAA